MIAILYSCAITPDIPEKIQVPIMANPTTDKVLFFNRLCRFSCFLLAIPAIIPKMANKIPRYLAPYF